MVVSDIYGVDDRKTIHTAVSNTQLHDREEVFSALFIRLLFFFSLM